MAIPASALPLALVNMLGFVKPVDGKPQPQNATVIQYISITFVAFPLLCYAIGFCIKAFMFPLKSKDTHDAIREGVEHQKRSGGPSPSGQCCLSLNLPKRCLKILSESGPSRSNKAVRDPITGSMITPLRLSEEEEDLAYALENFGPSLLTRLLASGDTNVVVQAMQRSLTSRLSTTHTNPVILGLCECKCPFAVLTLQPWLCRHIYVGTVFSVASLAMTAYTASIYLKDPVMAILPVTMVMAWSILQQIFRRQIQLA